MSILDFELGPAPRRGTRGLVAGVFIASAVACGDPCADGPQIISASNYDQSCKTAADCVLVTTGDACDSCFGVCPNDVISVAGKSRYDADGKRHG